MKAKAKVFRLNEIPERFWTKSGYYPNAEVCNSYHNHIEIDPHVFQQFEKAGNRVCVSNPRLEWVEGREMLCFSLGDYLYLIKVDRSKDFGGSTLWRVKWDRVGIVDVEGEITKIAIY